MAINAVNFSDTGPQISKLGELVDAVKTGVGIKGQIQSQNQAQKAYEEMNDPSSNYSQLRQQTMKSALGALVQKGFMKPDVAGQMSDQIENASGNSLDKLSESQPLFKLAESEMMANAKMNLTGFRSQDMENRQTERMDNANHQRILTKLKSDPSLTKRLAQYQNLGNALSNFQNADVSNPQAVDELQQAIRQNLGIGGGGVGEREHTYINSLGLNADRFQQFLTGDPVAISKDAPLAQHLKQLVGLESQNIATQTGKRVKALTSGNTSMYARRPDLKADLDDAVSSTHDQYSPASTPDQTQGGGGIIPSANAGTGGGMDIQSHAMAEMKRRGLVK